VVRQDGTPLGKGRPGDTWKIAARHYIQFKRRLCGIEQ
tara:strand:- start:15822 stop:15935 length:114 start_codon:yes stop_codon:yes gene_type:complete